MKKESKLSLFERGYLLLTGIAFDLLKISVVYIPPANPTKEEVDRNIANFKAMIARGDPGWDQ